MKNPFKTKDAIIILLIIIIIILISLTVFSLDKANKISGYYLFSNQKDDSLIFITSGYVINFIFLIVAGYMAYRYQNISYKNNIKILNKEKKGEQIISLANNINIYSSKRRVAASLLISALLDNKNNQIDLARKRHRDAIDEWNINIAIFNFEIHRLKLGKILKGKLEGNNQKDDDSIHNDFKIIQKYFNDYITLYEKEFDKSGGNVDGLSEIKKNEILKTVTDYLSKTQERKNLLLASVRLEAVFKKTNNLNTTLIKKSKL